MKTKIIIVAFAIVIMSCDKNDSELDRNSSIFILDSKIENLKTKGFLFEDLTIIDFPNSNDIKPDFIVLAQMNTKGVVVGPYLANIELSQVFKLIEEFSDLDSAKYFYENHSYTDCLRFSSAALDIKPLQVWSIITGDGNEGIVLILETSWQATNAAFAEITFHAKQIRLILPI